MALLPRLQTGNIVVYASDDELRVSAEAYLTKGALAVFPDVALEPLAVLDLSLIAPRLEAPLTLRCEVVVLQPERALLRILEPTAESFAPLLKLPDVIVPEPPAEEPPPAAVIVPEPPAEEPPAEEPAEEAEDSGEEPAPLTSLPPHLSGEVLAFRSEDDFNAAGRDLYTLGAVMATCDAPPSPGERREVKLQVESRLARTPLLALLQPGSGGLAIVQFEDKRGLAAVLPEILPPKTPPEAVIETDGEDDDAPEDGAVDDPEAQSPRVSLTLEPRGRLSNPTTAEGILGLALTRPLTAEDLAAPNTHLLLRWLLTSRGTVRVDIEFAGHPVYPFVVIAGREVRSPVAMPALGRNLVDPEGEYVAEELKRPPRMTHGGTMLQLMQEVVSALVGRVSDEELEQGLARHGDRSPLLNDIGKQLLEGLGFSSSHKRIAQKALTGKETVYGITQRAAGARSAFEVLYTLEVIGALDWVDAEGIVREERQRKEKERLDRLVEGASGFWEKIKDANHFEALGLHWSTPPRKIKPVFDELARLYGPDGEARADAPEVCDRIWRRVSDAYAVLQDQKRRRAHRKEAYPLKWSAQIDVLLDRADLATYRKDFQDALDLIQVCQDIHPTPEAADRMAKLQEARAKARVRDETIDDLELG